MDQVFISYASRDKFFAELLAIRLEDKGIRVWRDVSHIRAGEEWRDSIDRGIRESAALVLVLSESSVASHYVTYEWATASATGKTIIPIYLESCNRHPKIEPIQYMDFRNHNTASWDALTQRIQEILGQAEKSESMTVDFDERPIKLSADQMKARDEIKAYLNRKGFRIVSFYAVREHINSDYDEKFLNELVKRVGEFVPARVHFRNKKTGKFGVRNGMRLI